VIGRPLKTIDTLVGAILLRMNGTGGAVRVFGTEHIENISTDKSSGFIIMAIRPGESSTLHGTP
jgi:hypothetical protein